MRRFILHPKDPHICSWVALWPQWIRWAKRRAAWLSEAERKRLAAFQRKEVAERFLVHRTLTRRLLGKLLHTPPQAVQLTTDAKGKPLLEGHPSPAISLSHSGPWLAIALAPQGGHLGLDIERLLPDFDYLPLAKAYFDPRVRESLHTPADFFKAWTLREAVAKALGTGLTDELLAKTDEALLPPTATVRYHQLNHCLLCVVWWP